MARDESEFVRIYFDHSKDEDSEEEAETRWEGRGGHDPAHVGVVLLKQAISRCYYKAPRPEKRSNLTIPGPRLLVTVT